MHFFYKIAFLSLTLFILTSSKIIIPPPTPSSSSVALIFFQAANFSSDQYVNLLKEVQSMTSLPLWFGISDFSANLPNPLTASSQINDILAQMKSMGMPTPSKTFYAGHGLGGTILANELNTKKIDGLILLGSFLPKSTREITNPEGKSKINFPSKVLTIAHELDGMCRIMRIAEAFYHSVENVVAEGMNQFPVVVVKGASHAQFASGEPPSFVKSNDLKPEISEEEAHKAVAGLMVSFMEENQQVLLQSLQESSYFFKPLLDSLKLEGSYHLKPPCYDDSTVNRKVEYCGHGSEWGNMAHMYMAGFKDYNLTSVTLNTDDNFHKVWTVIPDPLPSCLNSCTLGSACSLSCISITQLGYNNYDDLDTGFYPISADEMKTKMNSRQALLNYAGLTNQDFTQTDSGSICRYINDRAIEWALANSGQESLERYQKIGEKIETTEDDEAFNGGIWIIDYLNFGEVLNDGDTVVEVKSYSSKYPLDYWLPISAGFHFCKLLSPARVMEWIYTDGLKKNGGV